MTENTNISDPINTALPVASANFETRRIQTFSDSTLLIKPTVLSLALCLVFIILGLVVAGLWAASAFTSFEGPGSIPLLFIGALFLAAGLGTYHSRNVQLKISGDTGVDFLRSWNPAASVDDMSSFKHIHTNNITAIQTISRDVKRRSNRNRRSSTYTEFQVNLCTSDATRCNVFVTLKPEKANDLAAKLAHTFDVPQVT